MLIMSRVKKSKVSVKQKPEPVTSQPSSISEYLKRMTSDVEAIHASLMKAPLSLTGESEPKLHGLIVEIQTKLADATKVWSI
jgi:hypothetical protein